MKRTRRVLLCLLLLTALTASGCAAAPPAPVYDRFSTSFFDTFDTLTTLMAYASDEATFQAAANQAHDRLMQLHQLYDGYTEYAGIQNIYVLNRDAAKAPVTVQKELMDLLVFCRDNQPATGGTTNIALGAVLRIWHNYREAGMADPERAELPPIDVLRTAAQHVDMTDVQLDPVNLTVFYRDPELKLDVGAVAKGYAAEVVAQELLQSPISSFILSAGGNVRVGNPPLDGKRIAWGIGIQDPRGNVFSDANSDIVETFFLSNMSVVTSGVYQRYYVVDGQPYHHLIDPATLMPGAYYESVTILTEHSGLADLLSTAAFLLPLEQSRALVASLPGVDALWVLPDGSIEMTDGARAHAKSAGASPAAPAQ